MDTQDRDDKLNQTRFAGELRRQLVTLAGGAGARERRHRGRRRLIIVVAATVAAAIALGAAALAGAFRSDVRVPWPKPPLPAASAYPTNAAGQTYGVNKPLVEQPDLIAAVGKHGVHGYLRKADIDGAPPKTPEEAAAQTKRSLRGYVIPLYASDGVTQVGVFRVGGPGVQAEMKQPDGTVITQEADRDGNIITTTTHPDGSMTIATEALDGTVTTRELTVAQAGRLRAETATPKPAATPTHEAPRPRPELLRHMSELARDAGDPHATAWWELQFRYYLKPIEGDASPESPYELWASVWLVVLHGDFAGADWRYWLLDRDSYDVLNSGQSDKRFKMSGPHLPAPQGPITLGND